MGKLAFWVLIIALALLASRVIGARARMSQKPRRERPEDGGAAAHTAQQGERLPPPEKMVSCVMCATQFPRSEGFADAHGFYCSQEHQRASHEARLKRSD